MVRLFKLYTKYDLFLILLIGSLIGGEIGGSLRLPRLLAILFLPQFLKKAKECSFIIRSYQTAFVVFYIYCLFSFVWTPDKAQGLKELFYYPVHFLFFLEIMVFSRYSENALKYISIGWWMAVAISIPIAIWELSTGQHLFLMEQYEDAVLWVDNITIERPFASTTFGGFNGYVTFLCLAMPFTLYATIVMGGSAPLRLLCILVPITALLIVIIIASRGGILSMLLMFLIFVLLSKDKKIKSAVAFLFIIAIYYLFQSNSIFLSGLENRASGAILFSDDTRIGIWHNAIRLLISSYGLGVGIGGLGAAMASLKVEIGATHNFFLEILSQYGIVFCSVFIIYFFYLLKKGLQKNERSIKTIVLMAVVSFPVIGIINSGYLRSPEIYAFFASISVFINYNRISVLNNVHPKDETI